ncbi:hypothetical protein LMH73_021890 [Vibrio splendidus]|nr:hypothetical protein [Vibrio splendidus]MCC4880491.1 hypothetical protein [Vibrio splendidus]
MTKSENQSKAITEQALLGDKDSVYDVVDREMPSFRRFAIGFVLAIIAVAGICIVKSL